MDLQFHGFLYGIYHENDLRGSIWGAAHKIPSPLKIPDIVNYVFTVSNIFALEHHFKKEQESSIEDLKKISFQSDFIFTEKTFLCGAKMLNKIVIPLETSKEYDDCIDQYRQLNKLEVSNYNVKFVAESDEVQLSSFEEMMPPEIRKISQERNCRIAERLDNLLLDNKDQLIFACFGALHTVGQNNIIDLLRQKRWTVVRVKTVEDQS